ncbi:heparin lyase I family protein [Streptomyces sp. NPDC050145]|uniref:heparin lyase I family protein n=1 Tax=Streptomyces sp. NPDC050145 TaxID=3365602 RepID=UPI003795A259
MNVKRSLPLLLSVGALAVPSLLNAPSAQGGEPHRPPGRIASAELDVDYESGTLDSGIAGLTTTHATAPDASAVIEPGRTGTHGVQHKVTLGDPAYESDGAPRSESATDLLPRGQFVPGDTQRYEFSVQLKDWKPFTAGDSDSGDIFFQGKYAGGNPPGFYLMTKRNDIAFRAPNLNLQSTVVQDFRPYINQWLDFRVDAHWATDATGWFKVSVRLPGESGYRPMASYQDIVSYKPQNPADHGYLKWGLYRPSESPAKGDVPTRIVRHDDIRIFDLP